MAQATATKIYEYEGKKYRLADHRDIGKEVYMDDADIEQAISDPCLLELTDISVTSDFPFKTAACGWRHAFVELEAPVLAVVPFNGTLEVGQWYETNEEKRLHCNSRTHHDTYPMVMVEEDGCVETYMEKGLWIEDHDMDAEDSIALHLVGCTGFDWPKPVSPAPAPEPQPVDTRPAPPAGWRYVAADEVLVEGDVYMTNTRTDGDVCSGIGKTVAELQKQGQGNWASYWVGVIRKIPKRDTGVAETDGWRILGDDEIVQEGDWCNAIRNPWKLYPIGTQCYAGNIAGWIKVGFNDKDIGKMAGPISSTLVYARKVEQKETPALSYEALVKSLVKPGQDIVDEMTATDAHLMHMVVGVCGEAGELLDAVKKAVIYRKELDRVNVIEELGDIEFYMEGLRQELGITREQCIKENIAKLTKRYGSMYSNEAAKNRADKAN
jgi:NTP pyrophosphatase (non-canonical NTP hydrolase)